MKVIVELTGKKRNLEIPEKSKVIDVVREARVNPETVIVKRGKEILLEEDPVRKDDEIELIRIISGG